MVLDKIFETTSAFINKISKCSRKNIGQFFTPMSVAKYMGELAAPTKHRLRILDAGAGTGILTASILQKLAKFDFIKEIELDLFENDVNILPILYKNIEIIKQTYKNVIVNVIEHNFIEYNSDLWKQGEFIPQYDIVISNPPYKKIGKSDNEAVIMPEIVYGQPNIYFLFMAMAVKLLSDNGDFIFIVPRSWTSGLYFRNFRKYFFNNMGVETIHIFTSRDKVFNGENVLQETMVIKAIKTKSIPEYIKITTSNGAQDIEDATVFSVHHSICVNPDHNHFLFIPSSINEAEILCKVNSYTNTLVDLGFKLKTGVTVDFRSQEWLKSERSKDTVPIFWAHHLNKGVVHFPIDGVENQYISTDNKSLLMENKNYLFLKRFTSKEERRRLQPAIFLAKNFTDAPFISTENHINFVTGVYRNISEDEVYGLYVLFNSTLWDKYYRILNGSTQVNATEINSIPFPELDSICFLGKNAKKYNYLSTKICDELIMELSKYEKRRCKKDSTSIGNACEAAG